MDFNAASKSITPPPPPPVSQLTLGFSLFLFLYLLNALFPLQSDDLGRGLGGIQAAISVYNNWLGRLGELLAVSFGSHFATTPYFAPLNALIGVYVIYAFFFVLFGRLPRNTIYDTSTIALILCIFLMDRAASFGGIFIVVFGAYNYLWAYMLIFSVLIPYRLFLTSVIDATPLYTPLASSPLWLRMIFSIGLLLLGVLAGWSSEFIIVVIFALIMLAIYVLITKKHLPLWYILGVLGLFLGFLIVFLAPGALKRIAVFKELGIPFHSFSEILALSLKEKIAWLQYVYGRANPVLFCSLILASGCYLVESSLSLSRKIVTMLLIIIASLAVRYGLSGGFFVLACVWCGFLAYLAHQKKAFYLRALMIALGGCFLACFLYKSANIQMGWLPKRTSLPFVLIHCVIILSFVRYALAMRYICIKNVARASFIFCACAMIFVAIASLDMRIKWNAMLSSIATQKALGQSDIVVDSYTFVSYYYGYGDFGNPGSNPNNWPNTTYAHYFGVKSFISKPMR